MVRNLRGLGLEKADDIQIEQGELEIDLRDNGLQEFLLPQQSADNLHVLLLARNILSILQPSIFCNIQILDVSDNRLSSLSLEGLGQLRILNASGNFFKEANSISGLQDCSSLKCLSLARNSLESFEIILRALSKSSLQVLDVIGNPGKLNRRDVGLLPSLIILNANTLPGKSGKEVELLMGDVQKGGIFWSMLPEKSSSEGRDTDADLTQMATGQSSGLSRIDEAGERLVPPTESSVSEFESAYDPDAPAGDLVAQPAVGLVERQDSANYQPRPPALTERQDSAQNLQALAEEEAALAALTENPITRADSAHELDDLSPRLRRANSTGLPTRDSGPVMNVMSDQPSSSAGMEIDNGISFPDFQLSERRIKTGSPFQTVFSSGSQGGQDWGQERTGSGPLSPDSEPSASLEAARLLMRIPIASSSQSFSPLNSASNHFLSRQDSASGSATRDGAGTMFGSPTTVEQSALLSAPSHLLQQARQMMQEASRDAYETSPSKRSSPDFSLRGHIPSGALQGGMPSPYDQPLTPLSPNWTAACIEDQRQVEQMPSIASGLPWTTSGPSSGSDSIHIPRRIPSTLRSSPPALQSPLQSQD